MLDILTSESGYKMYKLVENKTVTGSLSIDISSYFLIYVSYGSIYCPDSTTTAAYIETGVEGHIQKVFVNKRTSPSYVDGSTGGGTTIDIGQCCDFMIRNKDVARVIALDTGRKVDFTAIDSNLLSYSAIFNSTLSTITFKTNGTSGKTAINNMYIFGIK